MVVVLVVVISVVLGIAYFNSNSGGDPTLQTSLNLKKIAYLIDGQARPLGDSLQLFGQPVYGDLNGDGKQDAAVLLVDNPGGSGTFYYAVLAINKGGNYVATNALLLGDRIAPQTVEIRDGRAVYNYADRGPNEPMSTQPSFGKSLWINYDAMTGQIVAGQSEGVEGQIIKANFVCAGDKSIETTFHNYQGGTSTVDLKLSDGRNLTLPQAISASGARYANTDESFVFWNKGNTAFVAEQGQNTYVDCVFK